jgi:hypothetical protein
MNSNSNPSTFILIIWQQLVMIIMIFKLQYIKIVIIVCGFHLGFDMAFASFDCDCTLTSIARVKATQPWGSKANYGKWILDAIHFDLVFNVDFMVFKVRHLSFLRLHLNLGKSYNRRSLSNNLNANFFRIYNGDIMMETITISGF